MYSSDQILKHTIICNAFKIQLLYFSSSTASVTKDIIFLNAERTGRADRCNYLGYIVCSHDANVIIDNAIPDMNRRLHLLSEFPHIMIVVL